MSLSCIKPMQPLHQAVVSLSSSAPPLLRFLSSSTFSAPSCAHGEQQQQQQRLRRFSDAPSETSIPVPQAVKAHSRHPPLGPLRSSFQHQFYFVLVCFPYCYFVIYHIRRCVWLRCPQLPPLAWEFTSEVISVSATTVKESDLFLSTLTGHPSGHSCASKISV